MCLYFAPSDGKQIVDAAWAAKYVADTLNKDVATVSRWCSNAAQPSLENLAKAAKALDVDIKDLLESTKK